MPVGCVDISRPKPRKGRWKARQQAIGEFCMYCLGGETNPKDCTAKDCPLYRFRPKVLNKKND